MILTIFNDYFINVYVGRNLFMYVYERGVFSLLYCIYNPLWFVYGARCFWFSFLHTFFTFFNFPIGSEKQCNFGRFERPYTALAEIETTFVRL